MKREVCLLVGADGAVLWSDASDDPVRLPDSRARWEAIWRVRHALAEIAHSHPAGPLAFSAEDASTMKALDEGLGRALRYVVVAPEGMVVRHPDGRVERCEGEEPWWAGLLRLASGMGGRGQG